MSFDVFIHRVKLFAFLTLILIFLAIAAKKWLQRFPLSSKLRFARRDKADGIVFGWAVPGLVAYSPAEKEGHIAVLGGSGLGKTSAILIPTLRAWSGAVFAIDISGDICSNVPGEKLIFNPFGADRKTVYDPFYHLAALQSAEEQDEALERLAIMLMPLPPNIAENAAYFIKGGRKILSATLIAGYHAGRDFPSICRTIITHSFEDLFELLRHQNLEQVNSYLNSFSDTNEKNTAGCKQSCDDAIRLFASNHIVREALRRPSFGETAVSPLDLDDKRLFVVIPAEYLAQVAPLLRLITQQVLEHIHTRPLDSAVPLLLALDEFSSLGSLELLPAFQTARKHRVRIMILTQSLADLDLTYGPFERRSIIDNCSFLVILGATDHETQLYLAECVGKTQTLRETISIDGFSKAMHSYTPELQHHILPQDFARLGDDLIVLYPGGFARLKKSFYFRKKKKGKWHG